MRVLNRDALRSGIAFAIASAVLALTPGYAHDRSAGLAPLRANTTLDAQALTTDSATIESFAAVAAECVGDEAKYWRMRNLLLARAGLWSSGESLESYVVLAADAGLEPSAFTKCFESRRALQLSLAHRYAPAAPAFAEPTATRPALKT